MGRWLAKAERKFGRFSIRNLTLILIGCYIAGYLIRMVAPNVTVYLTLNPYAILHGQVWRIVTWLLIPPDTLNLFTIIMLFFYYSIGTTLERTWGTFRYNVYLFSGMLFTLIGAFILYGAANVMYAQEIATYGSEAVFYYGGVVLPSGETMTFMPAVWQLFFSTYYINMSIFLAFATTYPDLQVMLMFIIPLKVKYLGILYAVMLGYEFIMQNNFGARVAMVASLLNFLLFFFTTRNYKKISPQEFRRKYEYKKGVKEGQSYGQVVHFPGTGKSVITRHKCAICGRTELDDDTLEFRFCSKCEGNYEYCMEHLYTHTHVGSTDKTHSDDKGAY